MITIVVLASENVKSKRQESFDTEKFIPKSTKVSCLRTLNGL